MMRRRDDSAPETPQLPRDLALSRRRHRETRVIESVLLASTACLLAAVAWPIARHGVLETPPAAEATAPLAAVTPEPIPADGPTIQIALLLDTSSSMDGLIHQARTRLWSVVNSLDSATFHGARPRIEVAVYEYGNDRLSAEAGYMRQVIGFTPELDRVSQALFGLDTMGGSEFAGATIVRASDELAWRGGPGVMRVMYVAGNESFDQGNVPWTAAIDGARARGIVVNTVLCGSPDGYDAELWRTAATRAGGRFFAIDQDQVQAYVASPYDDEIGRLGTAINSTYVGYGGQGSLGLANQQRQDENNKIDGEGSVQRALSKGSSYYANPSWDLIDGVKSGAVDLAEIEQEALPEALRGLAEPEIEAFVAARQAERDAISARLGELRSERERWLVEHAETDAATAGLDRAMIDGMAEQARAAGFTLAGS